MFFEVFFWVVVSFVVVVVARVCRTIKKLEKIWGKLRCLSSRPGNFGKSGIFDHGLGKFGEFHDNGQQAICRRGIQGARKKEKKEKEKKKTDKSKKLGGQMMDNNSKKENAKFI